MILSSTPTDATATIGSAETRESPADPTQRAAPQPTRDAGTLRAHILVVDDEILNARLLQHHLSGVGYDVELAAGGIEALACVERAAPDVILLDVLMPDLDGYAVARTLKRDLRTRHIPIVMVTALDDREARVLGLQSGASEFLSKPVDAAELVARVRNLVRMKHYQDEQVRFKDEFLSHVSHELRSPLTAIKQFSSILLNGHAGTLSDDQQRLQEIVLRNVQQLQAMIDDLLEVTRLEGGKLTVMPEAVDVGLALRDASESVSAGATAKRITIVPTVEPGLPSLFADPTRLRQLLIILIDNAIKFSTEDSEVRVSITRSTERPGMAVIDVSDDGCGISPLATQQIFDRMFQVRESGQGSRQGLGLGLFICRELAERQDGTIGVSSTVGVGSTFSVTLPIFSLSRMLEPLLKQDWPSEHLCLVSIDATTHALDRVGAPVDQWASDARRTVLRSLMPTVDALIRTHRPDACSKHFVIAAFADESGATKLAKRIMSEIEAHSGLVGFGVKASATVTAVRSWPRRAHDVPATKLATLSAHLEALLAHDQSTPEGNP